MILIEFQNIWSKSISCFMLEIGKSLFSKFGNLILNTDPSPPPPTFLEFFPNWIFSFSRFPSKSTWNKISLYCVPRLGSPLVILRHKVQNKYYAVLYFGFHSYLVLLLCSFQMIELKNKGQPLYIDCMSVFE